MQELLPGSWGPQIVAYSQQYPGRRRWRWRGLRPPLAPSCVAIERPHHPDPCKHQPAAAGFRGIDQVLDRDLPALLLLHVLRQLHDVVGGMLQRRELAPAAQAYRLIERGRPRHFRPGVVMVVKPVGIGPESSRAAARACAPIQPFSIGPRRAPACRPSSSALLVLPWRACR